MKKILLGTTALVAASMVAAPGAQAAEKIKLGLGGYMWQTVGWSDQDGDFETAGGTNFRSWDQKSASEVHFKGSTKLDNGITVSAQIELEADSNVDANGGNHIDTSFLKISSASLGTLGLGKHKGTPWTMGHRGVNYSGTTENAGDHTVRHWISAPGANSASAGDTRFTGLGEVADVPKITYMTPRFMGFGAGVTFTPDDSNTSPVAVVDTNVAGDDAVFAATLAYDGTVAGVKVGADLSYLNRMDDAQDNARGRQGVGFGASFGYAGFTMSGSWNRFFVDQDGNTIADTASDDGYKWDIGLGYKTGPYAVSAYYTSAQSEGLLANANEDEYDALIIGGAYNLGPGVDLKASVFRADYDDETAANANNNDGWGVSAGMYLTF